MKKDHIEVPMPSSRFYRIKCAECEELQTIYSHATTPIACNSCGNNITTATGSKARINGHILETVE